MKRTLISILLLIFLCGCKSNIELPSGGNKDEEKLTPVKGGTINLFCDFPDTLNPVVTGFKSVSEVMYLVYDGLFRTENNFSSTPVLATSCTYENNNTRCIVNLRKDVTFHNGTSFDANDVVSTIDYIRSTGSKYNSNLKNVSSYYAQGDGMVVFELISPQPNFSNLLDFPILPAECSGDDFLAENKYFLPCGTGKYKFVSNDEKTLTLSVYEDNWYGDEPYAENIKITYIKDTGIAKYTFRAMETDIITTGLYSWGDTSMTGEFSTYEYESNRLTFIGLNCSNIALSDKNVRNALSASVDKEKLISDVMYTHAAAASFPINPNAFFASGGHISSHYEAGKALAALKNSGWLDLDNDGVLDKYFDQEQYSLSFNMIVNSSNNTSVRVAEWIAQNMRNEGVRINIVPLSYPSYIGAIQNGEYDMFVGRVDIANDCDISFMLRSGGEQNFYSYSSKNMDDALYKISTADGANSVKGAYKEFETVFKDETPVIPLYFETDAVFSSVRLKGELDVSRTGIFTGFHNVYVKYK